MLLLKICPSFSGIQKLLPFIFFFTRFPQSISEEKSNTQVIHRYTQSIHLKLSAKAS